VFCGFQTLQVAIAHDPTEFYSACDRVLAESADERAQRIWLMRERVASLSWDATVSQMAALIDEALEARTSLREAVGESDAKDEHMAIQGESRYVKQQPQDESLALTNGG